MSEFIKTALLQLLIAMMAGGVGGWVGVQVTLAELRIGIENAEKHIHTLESIASQHEDFRERIARLEVRCEQQ